MSEAAQGLEVAKLKNFGVSNVRFLVCVNVQTNSGAWRWPH